MSTTFMPRDCAALRAGRRDRRAARASARGRPRRGAAGRSWPRAETARARWCSAGRRGVSIIGTAPLAGATRWSMRNISCSAPMRRTPDSKAPSASIRSSASRRCNSARMNSRCRRRRARRTAVCATCLCSAGLRSCGSPFASTGSLVHSSRYCGQHHAPRGPVVVPLGAPDVHAVGDALRGRAYCPGPGLADVLRAALARERSARSASAARRGDARRAAARSAAATTPRSLVREVVAAAVEEAPQVVGAAHRDGAREDIGEPADHGRRVEGADGRAGRPDGRGRSDLQSARIAGTTSWRT
jgi:hypothetical protein